MVAHGERLFVAGGFLRSIFVRTTEVYDVSSDTWSTVSRALHSQHWGPGILSDDSRIYILGGFHFGSDEDPNVWARLTLFRRIIVGRIAKHAIC